MKKGITFITVIIAVIIMVIFASTVTISSISILNDSTKNKFATEIAFIQEAVNNYHDKHNEYPISNSVTVDLNDVSEKDIVQFVNEKKIGNSIVLYKLDFSKLGNIETIYGNIDDEKDIYVVSKTSGVVYYLKGVNMNGTTYFTLTDDLKNLIDYVEINENTVTKDGISFIPSTLEWTSNSISTRVVVPSEYTDVSVSVMRYK